MKYTPETRFLLDFSPEIGFIQETWFLCTSLTWKVLYIPTPTDDRPDAFRSRFSFR
ncbi:hypothetical protein QT975_21710 [Microcoleus sp. w2-18aC4]|uniref:hypothetical protein n=1 Tax=unclassified Microcoleus TaxID=2642155 RepID=UPI002FD5379A